MNLMRTKMISLLSEAKAGQEIGLFDQISISSESNADYEIDPAYKSVPLAANDYK